MEQPRRPCLRADRAAGMTRAHDPYHLDDLDLDHLRRRRGIKWSRPDPAVLPAWVADMDFLPPPAVRAALEGLLDRGDLGYPNWDGGSPLAPVFAQRMQQVHGWRAEREHVRTFTDLVQIVQVVLHLATRPGDGVALHVPNYPPFLETLHHMRRRALPSPITRSAAGWRFDAARLARDISEQGCRVLLLVNPHNPTGRVLTHDELAAIAEIVVDHDLLVIADEIHADLTYPGHTHVPFASLSAQVAARTVTATSATKAFNLAGIRCAVAHVGAPDLRARLEAQPPDLYGAVSVPGVEATLAAWSHGEEWLDAVRARLHRNRDRLARLVATHLPGVRFDPPEGSYLAWLDFRPLGLPEEPDDFFRAHAGVELSPGHTFGPGGRGFARLNFATSSDILTEIVTRMGAAVAP